MQTKQALILTSLVLLLLSGFSVVEGRLASGGEVNYVIPPNSGKCENILLPDDFPITPSVIQYTITSDCGGWCDLTEARVDAGGANSVTVPFCMNTFGRQLGESKKFTIALSYVDKQKTVSYGICVANQGGTSTADPNTMITDQPCASLNNLDVFSLKVDSPIKVQKGVETDYEILLHSTEKGRFKITIGKDSYQYEFDPSAGQLARIPRKITATKDMNFDVEVHFDPFIKNGYFECKLAACNKKQNVVVEVDKGLPTPTPVKTPTPAKTPTPTPKVTPSKTTPTPDASPTVVIQSPTPTPSTGTDVSPSPGTSPTAQTPTPSPDGGTVVQPNKKGFAASLFPNSISVKRGQEAQFLLEVENYDDFEKQFEITTDVPDRLKSNFDKINKKIGPAIKGSTTVIITPEGTECIYYFSVSVANSGSTKNIEGSVQVNEAACDQSRVINTVNLTDDQTNIINNGIISTRNSTKAEDIKTIQGVIQKINPPQPTTSIGPDGEVVQVIPPQTGLVFPVPPSEQGQQSQTINLTPGGGETGVPVIGPGQTGKPKPTKSPAEPIKIFGIDATLVIIIVVVVVVLLMVLMLKRGDRSKKNPWDRDWESERNYGRESY